MTENSKFIKQARAAHAAYIAKPTVRRAHALAGKMTKLITLLPPGHRLDGYHLKCLNTEYTAARTASMAKALIAWIPAILAETGY
jgi:hypothetical protein